MTPMTHGEIALGPSGNLQVTQKILCIETWIVLKRRINTVVSMPDRVIKKMNKWGERTKREE